MLHKKTITKLGDPRDIQMKNQTEAFKLAYEECLLLIDFVQSQWEEPAKHQAEIVAEVPEHQEDQNADLLSSMKACSVNLVRMTANTIENEQAHLVNNIAIPNRRVTRRANRAPAKKMVKKNLFK